MASSVATTPSTPPGASSSYALPASASRGTLTVRASPTGPSSTPAVIRRVQTPMLGLAGHERPFDGGGATPVRYQRGVHDDGLDRVEHVLSSRSGRTRTRRTRRAGARGARPGTPGSERLSGCSTGTPSSSATPLMRGACGVPCRPRGRSGLVTRTTGSGRGASPARTSSANGAVPAKAARMRLRGRRGSPRPGPRPARAGRAVRPHARSGSCGRRSGRRPGGRSRAG